MTDQHFKPHPKATPKRRRANRDAMAVLRERVLKLDRRCVVCEQRPSESVHHVLPRDYSGEDVALNLIGLCGTGTTRCHGLVEAWDMQARQKVRWVLETVKPGVRAYFVDRAGLALLDSLYPLAEPDAAGLSERGEARPEATVGMSPLTADTAPTPRSNFWGRPCPRWGSPAELDELFAECMLILKNMDAPVVKKGGGEAYSVLQLVFTDFRDRWREHLKGAA